MFLPFSIIIQENACLLSVASTFFLLVFSNEDSTVILFHFFFFFYYKRSSVYSRFIYLFINSIFLKFIMQSNLSSFSFVCLSFLLFQYICKLSHIYLTGMLPHQEHILSPCPACCTQGPSTNTTQHNTAVCPTVHVPIWQNSVPCGKAPKPASLGLTVTPSRNRHKSVNPKVLLFQRHVLRFQSSFHKCQLYIFFLCLPVQVFYFQ